MFIACIGKTINNDYHEATVPSGFSNFKAAIYTPHIEGKYAVYIFWDQFRDKATMPDG